MNPDNQAPLRKVYYRPIEAAIRWCGLEQNEADILRAMVGKMLPESDQFREWPTLRLNAERIFDAIANHELPFGIDGVTVQSGFRLDHPGLTIRHVDLRAWMSRYYPHERPHFLFDPNEPFEPAPESIQALLRDREQLRSSLTQREEELRQLRNRNIASAHGAGSVARSESLPLTLRAEATYLHIIGVMLRLLLRHSHFTTQEAIVNTMVDEFGKELMGITERTLHAKFAAANRKLEGR